jgi:predicted MPP superfamily phosphohydrolase
MNHPGYRILLCHHPEYRDRYLRKLSAQSDGRGVPSAGRNDQAENLDIDLILSGHAHGGQWRLYNPFKRQWIGVFAPGQGLWPRWTKGVYEGRLVVSAGLSNTVSVPRLFNPTEIVYIETA